MLGPNQFVIIRFRRSGSPTRTLPHTWVWHLYQQYFAREDSHRDAWVVGLWSIFSYIHCLSRHPDLGDPDAGNQYSIFRQKILIVLLFLAIFCINSKWKVFHSFYCMTSWCSIHFMTSWGFHSVCDVMMSHVFYDVSSCHFFSDVIWNVVYSVTSPRRITSVTSCGSHLFCDVACIRWRRGVSFILWRRQSVTSRRRIY